MDFLRATHPAKTAENVAADTGIPAARIDKWLDRVSAPKGADTAILVLAYGPRAMHAVIGNQSPAWLIKAAREEKQEQLLAQIAALEAQVKGLCQ